MLKCERRENVKKSKLLIRKAIHVRKRRRISKSRVTRWVDDVLSVRESTGKFPRAQETWQELD